MKKFDAYPYDRCESTHNLPYFDEKRNLKFRPIRCEKPLDHDGSHSFGGSITQVIWETEENKEDA